jgi:hypothetical protein
VGCFTDCYPFEEFPHPKSPDYINTDFILETRDGGAFDPSRAATYFLIHGFSHHANTPWMQEVKDELLIHGDYNVFLVDWRRGALPDPEAPAQPVPASNTRVVGRVVANYVRGLQGVQLDTVHCIGHSLGAHACGFFGKEFTGEKIGRISGLDPAGIQFSTCPEPECRLAAGDAALVDATHTNAWGTATTSGITVNCADVDVWPNHGQKQPGCGNDLTGICSHERATEFFAESINANCFFTSRTCDTFEDMQQDTCHETCSTAPCQHMGFHASESSARGTFLSRTHEESPFCVD